MPAANDPATRPAQPLGYWPLAGLRLRTRGGSGELELRPPGTADLTALASLAEAGVHDPNVQPFSVPWTDVEPGERARSVLQFHWTCLGSWTPEKWDLNLVVVRDGTVVGTQGVGGTDFAILREVGTGSWLGRQYQGQGIGTAMRAAALTLAFDGLGAEFALSAAFTDNPASLAVSRKLGYRDDGIRRQVIRGRPAQLQRLRLDRAAWQARRKDSADGYGEVLIEGLEPCLPMFGIATAFHDRGGLTAR
jgi:RimJ/RimL family protein N-acetyltransferase